MKSQRTDRGDSRPMTSADKTRPREDAGGLKIADVQQSEKNRR
jgi:hypothetical protein